MDWKFGYKINGGQHRGFAFVTYKSSGDAKHAMDTMNGKIIMGRRVVVKFANKINDEDINNKPDLKISALTGASSNSNRIGRETTIRAIESKLKLMENQSLDVCATFNKPAAGETSLVKNYQYNLNSKPIIEKRSNFDHKYRGYREHKPYTKKK
ncbi:probable RNA-binding protein 18 isoform X2 [Ctenocephalides felis]|uniref:probable RNA-binding protein 18 isoform X2 n=1 Tax=Ctenocephalides felis TaxID=7515 RepID=UPI000E6E2FBF|nr:probable RNA-binding protein 18 isoform X2 [Ctenocephalides felis]